MSLKEICIKSLNDLSYLHQNDYRLLVRNKSDDSCFLQQTASLYKRAAVNCDRDYNLIVDQESCAIPGSVYRRQPISKTLRTRPQLHWYARLIEAIFLTAPSAPAAVPCHCAKIWRQWSNSPADAWGLIHPVGCRVSFVLVGSLRSFGAVALCWI